jgi:hypothetical protein
LTRQTASVLGKKTEKSNGILLEGEMMRNERVNLASICNHSEKSISVALLLYIVSVAWMWILRWSSIKYTVSLLDLLHI